jgi:hypothetical protein
MTEPERCQVLAADLASVERYVERHVRAVEVTPS